MRGPAPNTCRCGPQAGGQAQPTVFLFSDTQLKEESFLEDINNILNTGEVRMRASQPWALHLLHEVPAPLQPAPRLQVPALLQPCLPGWRGMVAGAQPLPQGRAGHAHGAGHAARKARGQSPHPTGALPAAVLCCGGAEPQASLTASCPLTPACGVPAAHRTSQGSRLNGAVPCAAQGLYTYFVEQCRANLHLVIAMSPVGSAFRE